VLKWSSGLVRLTDHGLQPTAFGWIRQVQGENRRGDCPENVRVAAITLPPQHRVEGTGAEGLARAVAAEFVHVEAEAAKGHVLDEGDSAFVEDVADLFGT
jgi:hypothetical protein